MKKYIFTLIAMLMLTGMAYGVASNRVYYHIAVMDQWSEIITSPAITQIDVQNESGTAVAVYSTKTGSTEVGSTGVITSGLADGMTEFWYADTAIDLTVTDGTRTYEIESFSVRMSRFMLPSFLVATSSSNFGETDDLDFTYASWIFDGDTLNRLDMIPDNDGAILAIGDGTTQADFYIYSTSTSDYWLFDEGAGEVYYENIDLQFGDDDIQYFGADNDVSVTYDETTDDNFEITAASVGMSITTNDLLTTLDGVAADQFKVNATGTIDGDAINFETTDGGIMVNADGSSFGDIELNSADDTIITSAGDLTATVTGTAFIDATADVKITSSKNAANAVLITEDGGSTGTIKIHADTGTSVTEGAASLQLLSDGGGISLESNANLAKSIWIIADGGATETIKIESQHGTGDESVFLSSDAGGITLNAAAGSVDIEAVGASAGDIGINAADDMTVTVAGDATYVVTGTLTLGEIRYKRNVTVVTASTTTLMAVMSGNVYVTTAGSLTHTFTLPLAAAGLTFTFIDVSAAAGDDVLITANTSDKINGGTAAKHYVNVSDAIPGSVTLTAADAVNWYVTSSIGTWTNNE